MASKAQFIYSNKLASPEEVIKFIEEHDKKSNEMIDEGHDIIKKIKQMNKEISSELQNQNAMISDLDEEVEIAQTNIEKNDSKLDEIIKKTSTMSLTIGMIVQSIVVVLLIFI